MRHPVGCLILENSPGFFKEAWGNFYVKNFYIVKDMTEEFIYNWRYIDEKEYYEIQKNLRERNRGNVDKE